MRLLSAMDGFVDKSIPSLPLTDADLHLKQIRMGDLNKLGRDAMVHAFAGFGDFDKPSPTSLEAHRHELRRAFGVPNVEFDPRPYRRFAGDPSLPRARYYAVANEAGVDGGTLIGELRTYYVPWTAGVVQIFDSTEPRDQELLGALGIKDPGLLLVFLPLAGRPNRFASSRVTASGRLAVFLPLQVETRRARQIVDLRDSETARTFAQSLSSLRWNETDLSCFGRRPPLSDFGQLLPGLLHQGIGGGELTNTIGLLLRRNGAEGLVFPSVRRDASVQVLDGKLQAANGFNFVDYSGTSSTELQGMLDLADVWPTRILAAAEGPGKEWSYAVPGARVVFEANGVRAGSWQVQGLRRAREAQWRFSMAWVCVDAFAEGGSDPEVKPLYEWLFHMFERCFPRYRVSQGPPVASSQEEATQDLERLGSCCTMLQEALLGLEAQQNEMAALADEMRHANIKLAIALNLVLSRCRALVGNGA